MLNHGAQCRAYLGSATPRRPIRLLHISNLADSLVQLVEATNTSYAALSYCWGQDQLKTLKSNLKQLCYSVPVSDLSKSVQDGIKIAKNLKLRHIWVDCLCIVQDDPAEVAMEIDRMSDIYQGAVVTILAASSRSCGQGFLDLRSDQPSFEVALRMPNGVDEHIVMELHQRIEEPINTRAWCLQEALLSRRILSFNSKQISWNCAVMNLSDGGIAPADAGNMPLAKKIMREHGRGTGKGSVDVSLAWRIMVEQYCAREMSVASDKLPGLAGVAQMFNYIMQDTYVAGLWNSTLSVSLGWYLDDVIRPQEPRPRPTAYRAPTWSWASVDGYIRMPELETSKTSAPLHSIAILDVSVVPLSPLSLFGQIRSTSLRLRGLMRRFKWRGGCSRGRDHLGSMDSDEKTNTILGKIDVHPDTSDAVSDGSVVWMLVLRSFRAEPHGEAPRLLGLDGLILRRSPGMLELERVAYCYISPEYQDLAGPWIESFGSQAITIV